MKKTEVKKRQTAASSLLFFTANFSVLRSRPGTVAFCGAFGKRLRISGSGPVQKHPGLRDTAGHNKMASVITVVDEIENPAVIVPLGEIRLTLL